MRRSHLALLATLTLATLTLGATPALAQQQQEGAASTQQPGAAPGPGAGPLTYPNGRPTLTLLDGNFTIAPYLRLDADTGTYFNQLPRGGSRYRGAFREGANLRRGYLGVQGTFLHDFEYAFAYDVGGDTPNNYGTLYQAWMAYNLNPALTLKAGVFEGLYTLQYSQSSFDIPFLERASSINAAAGVAASAYRITGGAEFHEPRLFGSLYATGGRTNTLHDDQQHGIAARTAALVLDTAGVRLQLGFSGSVQLDPGTHPSGRVTAASQSFADYPELRLSSTRVLNSGSIAADQAWVIGPEAAFSYGRFTSQAEYQHFAVDTPATGRREFSGYYVEGVYVLLGEPRQRDVKRAAWTRPTVRDEFDPHTGHFGAIEVAGRFSTLDLRDGPVRGGAQRIWTAAVNWYPTRQLRFSAEYQHGTIAEDANRDRAFEALGFRAAFSL